MKTRRSQLQMGETIMVLVVFFILIMVGLVVYSYFRQNSIEKKTQERQSMQGIEIATMLTELPELQCSEFMCINCDGAVDLLKLRALAESCDTCDASGCNPCALPGSDSVIKTYRWDYAEMFSTTTVKLHVFSEVSEDPVVESYVLYNIIGKQDSSLSPYYIPVNFYDATTDECLMGIMEIKTWS